jgi:hypothetical protein
MISSRLAIDASGLIADSNGLQRFRRGVQLSQAAVDRHQPA